MSCFKSPHAQETTLEGFFEFSLLTETTCQDFYNEVIDRPTCAANDQRSKYLDFGSLQVTVHLTSDVTAEVPLGTKNHVKAKYDSTQKAEKDEWHADSLTHR